MCKRINFPLSFVIFLLTSVLLVSACSAPGEAPKQTDVPTEKLETTQTLPDTPESTPTEPTQKRLPRYPFDRPDISMTLPEGNPDRGEKIALAKVCLSCHVNSEGPPRFGVDGNLPAMRERATLRIKDPAYTGNATTPEEYLLESITDPRLYEVDGDWMESMADNYYDLPEQDLADLIAWMLTFE
jgi:cytochrome c2